MTINRLIHKENVVYIQKGILISQKKEKYDVICKKMGGGLSEYWQHIPASSRIWNPDTWRTTIQQLENTQEPRETEKGLTRKIEITEKLEKLKTTQRKE